jgi:hypothetical protein
MNCPHGAVGISPCNNCFGNFKTCIATRNLARFKTVAALPWVTLHAVLKLWGGYVNYYAYICPHCLLHRGLDHSQKFDVAKKEQQALPKRSSRWTKKVAKLLSHAEG